MLLLVPLVGAVVLDVVFAVCTAGLCLLLPCLLGSVCTGLMYCRAGVAAGLIVLCPCCCSTFIFYLNINTNPYKHTHELINVCYLLVVCPPP